MVCGKLSNFTSHHSYHIWFNHWFWTLNHCPLRFQISFLYASIHSSSIKFYKQTDFNILSRQLRFNLCDCKITQHPPLLFLHRALLCARISEAKRLKCVTMTATDKVFCLIQFYEWFWNNVTFRFSSACSTILLDFFVSHGNQYYLT